MSRPRMSQLKANAAAEHSFHLRNDHLAFERRLSELCACATDGDWRDLDYIWEAFVADVETHLQFEERELFGPYAEGGGERAALVERLRLEHAEMRRTMTDLGIEIQIHKIRASTIEAFVERMRRHASLEDTTIYPWAEQRAHAEALEDRWTSIRSPLGRGLPRS